MRRALWLILIATPLHAGNLISSMTFSESGDYKMARQDQLPVFISTPAGYAGSPCSTCAISRIWDGTNIKLFGAKGELLTWVTYLNASAAGNATNVMVKISSFTGTGAAAGTGFAAVQVSSANAWDYTQRPYSLYLYQYVQQIGITQIGGGYDPTEYDEQQLPPRFRLPCTGSGVDTQCASNDSRSESPTSIWITRQDHDKFYPDQAVPMEEFAISSFTVSASSSQAIGGEVYISTDVVAGSTYTATLTVYEGASVSTTIPIALYVYNVTMPSQPTIPVLAYVQLEDLADRLTGTRFPADFNVDPYYTNTIRVGAFLHRHRMTPIGNEYINGKNYPSPMWQKFFDGSAFKETYGLAYNTGPGYGVAESTHVIGPYGGWNTAGWSTTLTGGSDDFCTNASSYTYWCVTNNKKCYLYTKHDEAAVALDNTLALHLSTMAACAYSGHNLPYTQTGNFQTVAANQPDIQTVWSTQWMNASTQTYQNLLNVYLNSSTHSVGGYNTGIGAGSGMNIQEGGLGPREILWGAHKTRMTLWFLWQVVYWNDVNFAGQAQNGYNANAQGENNLNVIAKTFGLDAYPSTSSWKGHYGASFSAGEGILLYPATDKIYANPDYNFNGVIGSWKLNQWTRGSQDIDIIALANAVNPTLTTTYVNAMVQDVMHLRRCHDIADCSYSLGPRPWDQVANDWEVTRESLLQIAAGATVTSPPAKSFSGSGTFSGGGTFF